MTSSLPRSLVPALCEKAHTKEGEIRLWACLTAVTGGGGAGLESVT